MSVRPISDPASDTETNRAIALAVAELKPSIGIQGLINSMIDGTGFTDDREFNERLVIRYGFLNETTEFFDHDDANTASDFVTFNAAQIESFNKAIRIWEQYAFVDFVQMENEDSPGFLNGDEGGVELFVGGYGSGGAFAFVTGVGDGKTKFYEENAWFNLGRPEFSGAGLDYGGRGLRTFLHELGHVLGLQHPGNYDASDAETPTYFTNADFREDNRSLTIMSYFSEMYGGSDFFGVWPSTPMPADVEALNQLYIPPIDWTSWEGNTVYGWGSVFLPLTIHNAADKIVGTIYDYDGDNWLDVSPYVEAATINLTQMFQSVGGLINNIAILGIVTQITTGSGNDTITGADRAEYLDGGSGDDVIKGGGDDDRIFGGDGNDSLEGEGGYDKLNGGNDNDTLLGGGGNDELRGGFGHDSLVGGSHKDLLLGEGGNDTLVADGQGDRVFGGAGNDLVLAGFGNLTDSLSGGAGEDTLSFANFAAAPGEEGIGFDLENPGYVIGLPADFNPFHRIDEAGDPLPTPELDFESFTGSDGDDTLRGDANANRFNGGNGNDQLLGRDGADSLFGNAGKDTLNGGEGDDSLNGGSEDDLLLGGAGADTLNGGIGADALNGGVGDDLLLGGFQNDALDGGADNDLVLGEQGDDTLHGGGGLDTLMGGGGSDHVFFSSAGEAWANTDTDQPLLTDTDILDFGDLPLLLPELTGVIMDLGTGQAVLKGGGSTVATHGFRDVRGTILDDVFTSPLYGRFSVAARGGDDRVHVTLNSEFTADGGEGRDRVELDAKLFTATVTLDLAAGTLLRGGFSTNLTNFEDAKLEAGGDAVLRGTDGANWLTVILSDDTALAIVEGRDGDDEIDVTLARQINVDAGGGDDVIRLGQASGQVDGGTGTDTLDFSTGTPANRRLVVELVAGTALLFSGETTVGLVAVSGIENVTGQKDGPNRLVGDGGANILTGGTHGDELLGGGGDDTLISGGAVDILEGGEGEDQLVFDTPYTPKGEGRGGEGFDLLVLRSIKPAAPLVLDPLGGDQSIGALTFSGIEAVDFAVDVSFQTGVNFTGGAAADRLVGAKGNDTLAGVGGNDTLVGGEGDDLFLVGAGGGLDEIDGGAGTDTLRISYAGSGTGVLLDLGGGMFGGPPDPGDGGGGPPAPSPPPVATPIMTSIEVIELTLGDGADSVIGSIQGDLIDAAGGNDTVRPGAGPDTVHGGTGDDVIKDQGNRDADRLYGDDGNDSITAGGGADLIEGGAGNDLLVNSALYYPGFTNPDDERDTIRGGTGDDTIRATGPGVFDGGADQDLLVLDLRRIYPPGSGGITLDLSDPSVTVALPAGSSITGIERFELTLSGTNDVLTIGYGLHKLDADSGFDTLRLILAPGDAIPTYTIQPPPLPFMSAVWTFENGMTATGFEVLVILPVGSLPGVSKTGTLLNDSMNGGAGADTLSGGMGNDRLNGGAGVDLMIGGSGNDTYTVDHILDVVIEEADQGTDAVLTTLGAYTLGANVERLTYVGSGAFIGTGNELDNSLAGGTGNDTLFGGKGNDSLNGGLGADSMLGGTGNDTYSVDDIGDAVVEALGEGTDMVRTTLAAYTLTENVETLAFSGLGNFTGTGNALANSLAGGTGNDTLFGGEGNDALNGGLGADSMLGGAGNDTYTVDDAGDAVVEVLGEGTDLVRTTLTAHTLAENVENLVFVGLGNFTGTGNALANNLVGGVGNDTLLGGGGKDLLNGGAGLDRLEGGLGADVFVFRSAAEALGDMIADFSLAQGDRIDLRLMDANTLLALDQAFSWIGGASFGNVAGQLRFSGGTLAGDMDGDGLADFEIELSGVAALTAAYIWL